MALGRISPLRLVLWSLVALALAGVAWTAVVQPRLQTDVLSQLGRGDYQLVPTEGEPFTEDSLRGAPTAVFFGFTHCPEVCPTTLGEIGTWQDTLAEAGQDPLRVFFVTVDPRRDTEQVLGEYVSWVPDVVGVTGQPEQVDKALRAFRVYASRIPLENGDYTMDHSASVLLFDRRGRFFEPIGYQEDHDRVVDKIGRLIAG